MMSMRKSAVFGIGLGIAAGAAGQFFGLANAAGAGDIDVDVVLILGIDHQRVGVRSAAALHGGDLFGIREVADIENADAAETVGAGRAAGASARARRGAPGAPAAPAAAGEAAGDITGGQRDALGAAIDASVHGFGRHEEQMAVDRDVALSAGADQRSAQLDLRRVIDVVEIDAVVVADEEMIAAEGEVGIRGAVRNCGAASAAGSARRAASSAVAPDAPAGVAGLAVWRLHCVPGAKPGGLGRCRDLLHAEGGLAGVVQAALEADARIVVPERGLE